MKTSLANMFSSLEPRERNMLIIGGIILGILLAYALFWKPFSNKVERLEHTVQEQRTLQQWINTAAAEALRLRATQGASIGNTAGQSLLSVVDQAAKNDRLGSALKRIEPEGANKVRVWIEQAAFDDVLLWMGNLKKTYGVQVTNVSIDRQGSSARVNARITVEGGAQ
jgi:general secretion pathway protein M